MWRRAVNNLLRVFEHPDPDLEKELPELLRIFKDDLSEESKARITTLSDLFDELQKCQVIHVDDLSPLEQALGYVGRHDLVENIEELKRQRAEQSAPIQRYGAFLLINAIRFKRGAGSVARVAVGGAGSVARAAVGGAAVVAKAAVGAVNLKTVIRVGAAAVVAVTVYNVCTGTPPEFFDEFSTRALPHGNTLIEMSNGCLCFTVQAKDLSALRALWDSYQEGTLKARLQEFLVTEKIKQLANSQKVEVDVTIDEQEYKYACLDLMAAKVQVQSGWKRRRCSESDVSDYEAKAEQRFVLLESTRPLLEESKKQKMFPQVNNQDAGFLQEIKETSRRLLDGITMMNVSLVARGLTLVAACLILRRFLIN